MARKKRGKTHDATRARNLKMQEAKKARLAEVTARQIADQPVSQTAIAEEQPKPKGGRPKGSKNTAQRKSPDFDVVHDSAEKHTQLGKRNRSTTGYGRLSSE
jgi:hypothetical protein